MPENNSHGFTRSGVEITDELIDEWAAEAEAGYDVSHMRVVHRAAGDAEPARPFPVRLDPALRDALAQRAREENRPASEVVREALRRYLAAS